MKHKIIDINIDKEDFKCYSLISFKCYCGYRGFIRLDSEKSLLFQVKEKFNYHINCSNTEQLYYGQTGDFIGFDLV